MKFEESFSIQPNQKSLSTPKVIFSSDAFDVIRSFKIYNKKTNEVYYDGPIQDGASNYVLNGVEKGRLDIGIELRYFDGEVKELEFNVDNNYKWGSVSNPRITKGSEKTYLEWNEEITASKISSIEILLNGEVYKTVAPDTKKIALPSLNEGDKYQVKLVVYLFEES